MKAARLVVPAAVVAYPALVYGGLRVLSPRWLALAVGVVLLGRELLRPRGGAVSPLIVPIVLVGGIVGVAMALDDGRVFLFVPVLINLALFVSFARTLVSGPSMIETLARRRFGQVPPEHLRYCRRVTEVWCAFFVVNGAVILGLALRAPIEYWTLYTGVVAYVLVGLLFTAEMTYRAWRFRRYEGDVTDVVFRRLFPPKPAR